MEKPDTPATETDEETADAQPPKQSIDNATAREISDNDDSPA